jgi:ABC-2 type transport system permease protein
VVRVYNPFAGLALKFFLAYTVWVWVWFFLNILSMVILVYFWRAVYSNTTTVAGLSLSQTLNYILWAQIMFPIIQSNFVLHFGSLIREGAVGIELLRPVDFEARYYVQNLTDFLINIISRLPMIALAVFAFGLKLPNSLAGWGAALLSLFLGQAVSFFFDWIFACLAFYSTEVWGLAVLKDGVATFFSGAMLPLVMMPGWLQGIALAMPFAQSLAVPVSLFSGLLPLSRAPAAWMVQLGWLVSLGLASRAMFNVAVRKVTVQGG